MEKVCLLAERNNKARQRGLGGWEKERSETERESAKERGERVCERDRAPPLLILMLSILLLLLFLLILLLLLILHPILLAEREPSRTRGKLHCEHTTIDPACVSVCLPVCRLLLLPLWIIIPTIGVAGVDASICRV